VADLTELVGLDMSTVSNHLSVLRNVGLLVDERRGTQIFYTLKNPCVLKIFCCLDEFPAHHASNVSHGNTKIYNRAKPNQVLLTYHSH